MVTTDLGACEWFVWDLRRSNLLDRGQLDQVVGEFLAKNPRAEPPALAEFLIKKNILTPFQAERLLQGKTQGFVLGPFTLMDALGAGSMGTVYKAQSKNDNQWYAVKVLPRRSMWNVRIARRKVRSFEQCKHPSVVPFVDVGTAGGMHYLAWPLVAGETLDKIVQRDGRLHPGTASLYTQQIAEGLEDVHQQNLIHGLLKPSNLMVKTDGQMAILDFGIGCLLAETEGESLVDTMSTANSVTSGLDCASPESIMDPTNLTPRGDQYSLGCVLYYCLTGQYPFPEGSAAEKMMAHQTREPVPVRELNPEVPEGLAAVVQRLMQKDPEARYGHAAEVAEALRPFAVVSSWATTRRPAAAPKQAPAPAAPAAPAANPLRAGAIPFPEPPSARGSRPGAARQQPAPVAPERVSPAPASPAAIPSRQSLRTAPAAPAKPVAPPRPAASVAPVEAAPTPVAQPEEYDQPPRRRSWDERMGPLGIAVGAVVACALAWLLTWKLF